MKKICYNIKCKEYNLSCSKKQCYKRKLKPIKKPNKQFTLPIKTNYRYEDIFKK
jgi:hypothetical protein